MASSMPVSRVTDSANSARRAAADGRDADRSDIAVISAAPPLNSTAVRRSAARAQARATSVTL
jgi:hypothetical protein